MSALLPSKIFDHYGEIDEARRLARGAGELERVRMQELIGRRLPQSPSTILHVGGAAGVYALWHGKDMRFLIDPVPRHVEQARPSCVLAKKGAALFLGDYYRPKGMGRSAVGEQPPYRLYSRSAANLGPSQSAMTFAKGGALPLAGSSCNNALLARGNFRAGFRHFRMQAANPWAFKRAFSHPS